MPLPLRRPARVKRPALWRRSPRWPMPGSRKARAWIHHLRASFCRRDWPCQSC